MAAHEEHFAPLDSTADAGVESPAPLVNPAVLERQLRGDLACARCRYNLAGLTVRGNCPECNLPIRATLRAVIDPHAMELQPIRFRRVVAGGLQVWAWGAVLAVLTLWLLRAAEMFQWPLPGWMMEAPAWLIAASGAGALVLIRPHGEIPWRHQAAAVAAVGAYGVLALATWRINVGLDPAAGSPYVIMAVDPARTVLRLISAAALLVILMGLRPNARLLVARSMLLRSGRVDRQTMLALVAVVMCGAAGDGLLWLAAQPDSTSDVLRLGAIVLVLVASLLFTAGMVGVVVDCWRLRHAVLSRPLSLAHVTSD